jgi:hypothetical protein
MCFHAGSGQGRCLGEAAVPRFGGHAALGVVRLFRQKQILSVCAEAQTGGAEYLVTGRVVADVFPHGSHHSGEFLPQYADALRCPPSRVEPHGQAEAQGKLHAAHLAVAGGDAGGFNADKHFVGSRFWGGDFTGHQAFGVVISGPDYRFHRFTAILSLH